MVLFAHFTKGLIRFMLRIAKLTDYSLLIMSQMAKEPESVLSATLLAERLLLSVPTVSKILKMLSDAGLVNSVRGAEGGYHLAHSPKEITIADVLNAMEGELAMMECCLRKNLCQREASCAIRLNWQKINTQVASLLASFTLVDMLEPIL